MRVPFQRESGGPATCGVPNKSGRHTHSRSLCRLRGEVLSTTNTLAVTDSRPVRFLNPVQPPGDG